MQKARIAKMQNDFLIKQVTKEIFQASIIQEVENKLKIKR